MTDNDGAESRAAECCGECGDPRSGDEEFCDNCHAANWVKGSSPQPEPQASEPSPAPKPAAVPDPVSASRASHLIASFTVKGNSFSHTLSAGQTIALGRNPDWSPLSHHFDADDSVSRKHAELAFGADGRARLTDKESTNYTVVNGKKLPKDTPWEVTRRDQIALGEYTTLTIRVIGGSGHGPAPAGGES